jgi:ABC-2 type transport system permease protein
MTTTTTQASVRSASAVAPSGAQHVERSGVLSQVARLYMSEIRLFFRESQVLVFVFGFPIITVLVLGGVFGNATDDVAFEFVNPQHFYVAAYFGVVLAAIGLIMLPAHIASYREQGVLRRFDTAGFPSWAFAAVQFLCGATFALCGFASLLVTAWAAFGVPPIVDLPRTLAGLALGTLAFISIGVALGMFLPSARAAQGLGLTMFFPMFLLAGGGPPPDALSPVMRSIAQWMPLSHVIRAIQEPWLGVGEGQSHLFIVVGILLASTVVWLLRSRSVLRSS